jgi:predicted GNAT family N-acyltransferase
VCAAVVSSQTFKGHGGSSKAKMASSIKKCLQMPCDGKTMLDTQKYTFVFCFFQFGFHCFLKNTLLLKKKPTKIILVLPKT